MHTKNKLIAEEKVHRGAIGARDWEASCYNRHTAIPTDGQTKQSVEVD